MAVSAHREGGERGRDLVRGRGKSLIKERWRKEGNGRREAVRSCQEWRSREETGQREELHSVHLNVRKGDRGS